MLQPVNLQLAHFNVEHSAQISKDALAAAQQTGQGKEVVQESVRSTQMVQAGIAAAETKKVKRKGEDEERERRRERQGDSFSGRRGQSGDDTESESAQIDQINEQIEERIEKIEVKKAPKSFELYA